jgi:hypothetical protein
MPPGGLGPPDQTIGISHRDAESTSSSEEDAIEEHEPLLPTSASRGDWMLNAAQNLVSQSG